MIDEKALKVLESIARRYSYVSKSRKYRNSVDGSIVTLDNAVESVLSEFALNHTTEYAPYQNKREELATTVRECIKGATRERKQRQVTRSIEATQTGATTSSLGGKSTHNPGWKPFMTFNMIDLEWCHGIKYCPTSRADPSGVSRAWAEHPGGRTHPDLVRAHMEPGTVPASKCSTLAAGSESRNRGNSPHHCRRDNR